MTNPEEVKDKFYKELHSVIAAVPKADKLIILIFRWKSHTQNLEDTCVQIPVSQLKVLPMYFIPQILFATYAH